ncbi:MAG: hypothetical protein OEY92_04865 [Elusimicrobiota bacterium]|nr:hypothetical protein [Elusimicrobiota bacterium]
MPDQEIYSERFRTDRGKTFFFDVKENMNGKFVKITESIPLGGERYKRNFITVSEESLGEFITLARKVVDVINGHKKES